MAPEQSALTCSGLSAEITTQLLILGLPPRDACMPFSGDCLLRGVGIAIWTQSIALLHQCWSFFRVVFSEGVTPATTKGYVASISAEHVPMGGVSVGRHPLVSCFMQGSRWLRPFRPARVPFWDLSIVLEGLASHLFEPLESVSEKQRHLRQFFCWRYPT